MGSIIKKSLLTAIGTASFAAANADRILKVVAKKGLINTKDARGLIKKLVDEAEREKKRIKNIIAIELKRQAGKAKPIVNKGKKKVKKAVASARRKVKSARKGVQRAQRTAEKRGKKIVGKAVRRLR